MNTSSQQLQNLRSILSAAAFSAVSPYLDPEHPIESLLREYKAGTFSKYRRLSAMMQFVADVNMCHKDSTKVADPAVAAKHLMPELAWSDKEKFAVVLMDVKHTIIATEIISVGTSTECCADPKEVFRTALRYGANRILVAHNHPSGNLEQSPEDVQLTRRLLQCASLMGCPMLDHLIIGNGDFASLRERTTLWTEFPQN